MARMENGKYVPNKAIKVSQLTIDSMKKLGMKKAIERANSGEASEEELEGARRFYGSRITGAAKKPIESPTVSKTAERSHVIGEAKAPMRGHVIGEAKANTVSKNYKPGRKSV